MPKLVANDLTLFQTLVTAVFPGASLHPPTSAALRAAVSRLCAESAYEEGELWVDKVMQLHEIANIHHGVIMVGPAATGQEKKQ